MISWVNSLYCSNFILSISRLIKQFKLRGVPSVKNYDVLKDFFD